MAPPRSLRLLPVVATAVLCAALTGAARGDGPTPPGWLGDVPGLGAAAPDPWPAQVSNDLRGCTIANPLLPDDPRRLRSFVPPRYRLGTNAFFGPNAATLLVADLRCADATDGGRPFALTLLAVQVQPDAQAEADAADWAWSTYTRSTLNVLPSSSWYLLRAWTDSPGLAAELEHAHLPVTFSPQIDRSQEYGGLVKVDAIDVPHEISVQTRTRFPDAFVHDHDWFFWHDRSRGRRATGFLLHLHAMSDSSCGYNGSAVVASTPLSCGATVTATAGGLLAEYLGAHSRVTPYAFNHPPTAASGAGYLQLLGVPAGCTKEGRRCAQS